jgi:hypothetical protein
VAQVEEHLQSKHETLNSIPSTTKKKKIINCIVWEKDNSILKII